MSVSAHKRLTAYICAPIIACSVSVLGLLSVIVLQTDLKGSFTGQILAGDQAVNEQLPTTLNTMHSVTDGNNPIIKSLTSYGFWVAVILFAIPLSYFILKILLQYMEKNENQFSKETSQEMA